jgi:hypothetical protein
MRMVGFLRKYLRLTGEEASVIGQREESWEQKEGTSLCLLFSVAIEIRRACRPTSNRGPAGSLPKMLTRTLA